MQTEFKATQKKSVPLASQIDRLVSYLNAAGETWTPGSQVAADLALDERRIRYLAEHSACLVVSGPGCPGYRHLHHTTPVQIGEVINRLQSQAKRMIQRSIRISKAAHAIIR